MVVAPGLSAVFHGGELQQKLVGVLLQAVRVVVDDTLDADLRLLLDQGQQLIDLLLVFGDHNAGVGGADDVLQL